MFVFLFEDLIKLAKSLKPTKINILKVSVSFYYPLGFIAPVTARVKVTSDDCMTDELKKCLYQFYIFSTKFNSHQNSKICFCCYNRGNKVRPVTWLL